MLNKINITDILFLDIETVPQVYKFDDLNETKQKLWDQKTKYKQRDGKTAKDIYEKAGIQAEFGKIVCISVGLINKKDDSYELRLKSYSGYNEKQVLSDFVELLEHHYKKKTTSAVCPQWQRIRFSISGQAHAH